uniref:Transposase Tc1-like domain-containing protein n=1 Tax=Clytia hemisphaerica TaxID=252671 RepID=A0A7M5VCZ3_9CNID
MKRPIGEEILDRRTLNKGRPKALTSRDERRIPRIAEQLRESQDHFTIKRVKTAAGVQNVCDETVRKVYCKVGLRYTHFRKKGILKRKDLRARLEFCVLDLDGVGFAHKYNPFN